jgi:putative membrane protein
MPAAGGSSDRSPTHTEHLEDPMNPHDRLPPGQGPQGWEESSSALLPFLGGFLLLLLVVALVTLYLWRQGRLSLPGLTGGRAPEDAARRILAERYARGDIGSDDFLERASVLNWTPGHDTLTSSRRRRRG